MGDLVLLPERSVSTFFFFPSVIKEWGAPRLLFVSHWRWGCETEGGGGGLRAYSAGGLI